MSDRPLQVGDLCVGQNMLVDTQYNGMECVVTRFEIDEFLEDMQRWLRVKV